MRMKKISKIEMALKDFDPKELALQIKDDGYKLFASKSKTGSVSLYTRRGTSVTAKLPGIETAIDAQAPNGSAWLGELVYLINGKQSISAVGSIMQSTPERAVEQTNGLGGKLEFRIYDVLEYDGKKVMEMPWNERDAIVRGTFKGRGDVRAVKTYTWGRRKEALREAKRQNAEGLVIKPKDSAYVYNRQGEDEPVGPWFKFKPLRKANHTEVLLRAYRPGKAKLIFAAFQYDGDGKLVEVGQLSGLPKETERRVRKAIDDGKEVLVEVSYQERMPSQKLRHMGWVRLRPDKPKKSAKINQNPSMPRPRQRNAAPRGSRTLPYQGHEIDIIPLGDEPESPDEGQDWTYWVRGPRYQSRGMMETVHSSPEEAFEAAKGNIEFWGGLKENPRTSKVKVALGKQALNYPKFKDFANAYWNHCARGIYWYPTNDESFDISARQQRAAKNGKFSVFCNPLLALSGANKNKKYVAEINVSNVMRSKIVAVRGQQGAKIRIMDLQDAYVLRVLSAEKAKRSWRYQQGLLPSSKDQLRRFWTDVRSKEKERLRKDALRAERRAKRLQKRAARRGSRRRSNPLVRMLPEHFNNPNF
jgi:hypothetical protein